MEGYIIIQYDYLKGHCWLGLTTGMDTKNITKEEKYMGLDDIQALHIKSRNSLILRKTKTKTFPDTSAART